ncbi:LPS export ABC transporter permease LptF [Limnohabitans sp. T6-5]|uniref:LPS export ABC transporter permease LptF n=1 Tax=Limnohabitans sp. T6-5 TaxID=1100724 RepID=UPI000D3DA6D7|nr:LPS export ABC transporter permease LptF [Limnohabitans sp. T6-5]PUE11410.1 LPS export ABC transporter permease LptF [Limnohabitans sp. T6-5]
MVFQSSLRKDLAQSFVTTLVVLLTVVMTNMLIQTLGQASQGSINPSDVLLVMGFTALGYSATLLTLSLFLSVVSTLSRMYSDSEMVIWFCSGRSLFSFVRPILRFAWPILLAIFFSALVVWPWSNQKIQELKNRFESRSDVERVAPGKFQEFSGGKSVFFIDKENTGSLAGTNVFVSTTDGDWQVITTAQQGRVDKIKDERFLKLQNGQQVSLNTVTHETRITSFENYQLLISEQATTASSALANYMVHSLELIQSPNESRMGELFWRIGQGLCALNLVFLAVALAAVNPRAAKSYHLMKAILTFIIYYNMINFGQRWIAEGRMSLTLLLICLHGSAALFASLWIMTRQSNWTIRLWLFRRQNI